MTNYEKCWNDLKFIISGIEQNTSENECNKLSKGLLNAVFGSLENKMKELEKKYTK
jgi:hypothetical protein